MLGKLLKYEFKDTARIIPLFYLISLVFVGITLSAAQLGIDWFKITSSVILLLLGIAVIIITFAVIVMRFYRNLYSNEGYLMFTLPVKPQLLLASKTIAAFIWLLISSLVCIAVIGVSLYGFGVKKDDFSEIFTQMKEYGLQNMVYLLIPVILLSMLYLLGQIYLAITMANLPVFHSMGIAAAFLIYVAEYVVLKIFESILAIFIPLSIEIDLVGNVSASLTNKNMFNFMVKSMEGATGSIVIGLGGLLFELVMVCVLFIVNGRLMKNKISLK